jgi:tetratricopeptide (TPR) repeat protein
MEGRTKRGHSSHQGAANKSFRIGGSLAEENEVRSFNRPRNNRSMAPSQPHRIELPLFFNTPTRTSEDHSLLNKTTQEEGARLDERTDNATYITVMRRLKDYEMLAFGCRRAGKVRDEGRAYYSIGVLYDNIKKYKKAVELYLKFLQVCKSINDSHGEALAYNCIGVDYQLLGEADPEYAKKAIEYHLLHEGLADVNGKFLACINLGLCHDRLGDQKNSVFYFQNALKHSIQMSNLSGQSVAMGNIGKIGTKDLSDNKDKMKLFV